MNRLYLVHIRPCPAETSSSDDMVELGDGLYLIRTDQTRSQLYHSVKRRHAPRQLLVAPLADLPKFKGMRPGSTKKARSLDK